MTNDDALYECASCGLHYTDPQRAEDCYRHGTTQGSCNLEITEDSVERRRRAQQAQRPGRA